MTSVNKKQNVLFVSAILDRSVVRDVKVVFLFIPRFETHCPISAQNILSSGKVRIRKQALCVFLLHMYFVVIKLIWLASPSV